MVFPSGYSRTSAQPENNQRNNEWWMSVISNESLIFYTSRGSHRARSNDIKMTRRDICGHFWCPWVIPQCWHAKRKMYHIKNWQWLCRHHVWGKSKTQEECVYGKWSKGDIPVGIEISLWMHVVCTIMVQPILKNFEIP